MYFGLSFSRVGFDFRPLLAPIFERTVLKQFDRLINFEANAKLLSDSFVGLNLMKAGGIQCTVPVQVQHLDIYLKLINT